MTQTKNYSFNFPEKLVATYPLAKRSDSRLLHVANDGRFYDLQFKDLSDLCRPNDLLVVNNSKVIQARLSLQKQSGGKVELLVERLLSPQRAWASLRSSKPVRIGSTLLLGEQHKLLVEEYQEPLYLVASDKESFEKLLQCYGKTPLPPYIKRPIGNEDKARYQTVYAKYSGSVAAPTAGLHFSKTMIDTLQKRGVAYAELTLHIGLGTFTPIRSRQIEQHTMHSERLQISKALCAAYTQCRKRGGRVIAVGTTVVRGLETALVDGALNPYNDETDLFITPGFQFQAVDVLITNFHFPETTLFVLVCTFAGHQRMLDAYSHAIKHRYRLFSYGDAMWIDKNHGI